MQYLSANPIQLCKLLPCIANLIALMAITKICPAYNNPVRGGGTVRRNIHLWKKAEMVSLREHITYFATSCHARYTHRSRSSGPHSMIKSSKWWPTAFHWNGPPPDIIKPGRTQISNGLPNVKKAFTKYWSGERDKYKNHLIRLEKQMK